MVKQNMHKQQLIKQLIKVVPSINFVEGDSFCWSPENKTIIYSDKLLTSPSGQWALLHEVAHATLKHKNYSSDLGLLKLEVEAWDKAKVIASKFNIVIDEDHIQDCLDTYRDWLHRRSTCPTCQIICIQTNSTTYNCHNCGTSWIVSASRFCRPYRLTIKNSKEKRLQTKAATFS